MDPRFGRWLKPIAAITVAFFSFYCIEPWNYLALAQTAPKNGDRPVAPTATKPQSASGQFEDSLRATQQLLENLDQDVSSGKDITLQLETLKGHQQSLESADSDIQAEFASTTSFLKEKKLPKEILKRQEVALQRYQKAYNRFVNDIEELHRLEAVRKAAAQENDPTAWKRAQAELKEKLQSLREQLKDTSPTERRLNPPTESVPNRTRELKTPKTDKFSFLKPITDFLFPSAYAAEPPPVSGDLAETVEVQLTQEIRDLAAELDNNAVKIYEFVRNGFRFEAYRGSMKGATQTLREKAGNDVDLASLLIALYRAAGTGAHYVQGTIEVPIDRAKAWVGIDDPKMVGSLFMSQGIPTTLMYRGAQVEAIRIQHVWVEAYVPFLNGRGALTGPGDTWVQMDPSFKTHTINQTLTLSGAPFFDQAAYLSTFRTESPLDFYKTALQGFLDANAPDYVPGALARNMEITPEFLGILVGQPPYTVLSIASTFAEVPDNLRQKFTLTIQDPVTAETELTYTAPMPSVIGKRLTLSYAPATAADAATIAAYGTLYDTPPYLIHLVPQVKLEGQVVAQGQSIGSGEDQRMRFTFNDGFFTEQVENNIIAGEYYAIALNGQNVTREEAFDRSQRLAQINETINLADPTTLDDRLGELLYLSALTFHQNLDAGIREMAPLHQVADVRDVAEMMYFLTVQVDDLLGVPKTITPVGITGDLDRDTHLVIPVDGDLSRIKPFMLLEGTQSSYLEHKVTEGIYNTEAISAVKAIQLAHDQIVPVHTVTKQNVASLLPVLQLSSDLETEIANAANAGMEITVPERNLVVQDWSGVGYIVLNPANGEGAYRISGGFGGVGIVRIGIIQDMAVTPCSEIADNVTAATARQTVCFPGFDNDIYDRENVCYTSLTYFEIEENCGLNDPQCRIRYGFTNPGYEQPLIDILENGLTVNLTKNVTAQQWQSQDDARYMRVGLAVLNNIEALMKYFHVTQHHLRPEGSGYRTPARNRSVNGQPTSHHMEGVAADITLTDPEPGYTTPKQCDVLAQSDFLIGGFGEVLKENYPATVHIAIVGKLGRDYNRVSWRCAP
jgi:transglutaminase-like putative cysteine protease